MKHPQSFFGSVVVTSPPARGARIETRAEAKKIRPLLVAPRAGGED